MPDLYSELSARLGLPYLMPSQAQKHVTVNEALGRLDGLAQCTVLDRDLSAPPSEPSEGDLYLVAASASGDWTGQDGALALFLSGAWHFTEPKEGWRAWIADEAVLAVYHAETWVTLAHPPAEDLTLCAGSFGSATRARILEGEHTISAGTTSTTSLEIPDRMIVLGVTARVTSAIGGATSFDLGVAGASNRYGTAIGAVLDSVNIGVSGTPTAYYSTTPLVLSANGASFTGGAVKLAIHGWSLDPPL